MQLPTRSLTNGLQTKTNWLNKHKKAQQHHLHE